VIIKIHSFIDVITNSSTEIYVRASQSSIDSVKKLVNSLLAFAGNKQTADDLFEFKLVDYGVDDRLRCAAYEELERVDKSFSGKDWMEHHKLATAFVQSTKDLIAQGESTPNWYYNAETETETEYHDSIGLEVTARANDANAELAAKVMSNLSSLFEVGEYCDN